MGVQVLAAGNAGAVFVRAQKVPVGSGWFRPVLQLPPAALQPSWWHFCESVLRKKSKDAGQAMQSEVKSVRNSPVTTGSEMPP